MAAELAVMAHLTSAHITGLYILAAVAAATQDLLQALAAPALSLSATSPHSNGTLRKAKRKQHRRRGDCRK